MKYFLFPILLLFFTNLYPQATLDKTIYLDSLYNISTIENYSYSRVIRNYYGNSDHYKIQEYYKSGQLEMEGNLYDKIELKKNGEFVFFYENGNKKLVTNYKNSIEIGKYNSWYKDGNKKIDGEYLKNKKDEKYRGELKINQFWNSENIQKVINGSGYYEDSNKTSYASGKVKNGLKDSIWVGNDKKYNFVYTEKYEKGQLISGTSINSNKKSFEYKSVFIGPESKKGIKDFYEYISKNLNPSETISGKIIMTFIVNTDGSVTDVTVIKGLEKKIDQQAKILIAEYPYWKPATYRGIEVEASLKIPISFENQNRD